MSRLTQAAAGAHVHAHDTAQLQVELHAHVCQPNTHVSRAAGMYVSTGQSPVVNRPWLSSGPWPGGGDFWFKTFGQIYAALPLRVFLCWLSSFSFIILLVHFIPFNVYL